MTITRINDQFDFFDQIQFKSINHWFHDNIRIKQYIPYIAVRKHIKFGIMDFLYYIKLDKLYQIIDRYSQELINNRDFIDIRILMSLCCLIKSINTMYRMVY